jgi:diacylglycerol O-acyltransferase
MAMPINMRSATGDLVVGNQFVPARFVFRASIADPVERMRSLHDLVARQRGEPGLSLAGPVSAVLNRLPMSVAAAVLGSMMKAIDVVTSNVPGAPMTVYTAGARVEATYGFGPLSGAAVNVTLLSYIDDVHVAVSTDPAAVPDPEVFLTCLQAGFDEIEALA